MITNIRILKNNYVWFLYNNNKCIIIDPGLFNPVLKFIKDKKWNPIAVLITHNHEDHTNGIKKLLFHYPNLPVYGPFDTLKKGTNYIISEKNKKIKLLNYKIKILDTPGHTLNHISYYVKPYLFCGDTLFSGGCGKVYKDLYHLMYHSLKKIASLPNNTLICCAHEYSYANYIFLKHIFPKFKNINFYLKNSKKLINCKNNEFPTTLEQEKKTNIFLNINDINYQIIKKFNYEKFYPWDFFKYLRIRKDNFWS